MLAAALAACSGGNHGSAAGPALGDNPVAFPLFEGADVLSSHQWHAHDNGPAGGRPISAVLAQGAGTYDGHDVVAGTQAFMPALEAWLGDLSAHPPARLRGRGERKRHRSGAHAHARAGSGLSPPSRRAEKETARSGRAWSSILQTLDEKAGPMLGLIGRFKHAPKMMRDPIDAQAKRQTGFSITDATNPDTPVGAAVAALDELRDFGGRGIVLIDAVKQ